MIVFCLLSAKEPGKSLALESAPRQNQATLDLSLTESESRQIETTLSLLLAWRSPMWIARSILDES